MPEGQPGQVGAALPSESESSAVFFSWLLLPKLSTLHPLALPLLLVQVVLPQHQKSRSACFWFSFLSPCRFFSTSISNSESLVWFFSTFMGLFSSSPSIFFCTLFFSSSFSAWKFSVVQCSMVYIESDLCQAAGAPDVEAEDGQVQADLVVQCLFVNVAFLHYVDVLLCVRYTFLLKRAINWFRSFWSLHSLSLRTLRGHLR